LPSEPLPQPIEDNLLDHIETYVQGGTLRFEIESGIDRSPFEQIS
jgi:hypothetical protein